MCCSTLSATSRRWRRVWRLTNVILRHRGDAPRSVLIYKRHKLYMRLHTEHKRADLFQTKHLPQTNNISTHTTDMADNLRASQDIKSSSEYQALHKYLHGHIDASAAQEKFCEPVENQFMTSQNTDSLEGLLWMAWRAVTGIAAETPFESERRQKLADFIISLESRQTLQKGGAVCKVWDQTVWKDLPVFGAQLRDEWNFGMLFMLCWLQH